MSNLFKLAALPLCVAASIMLLPKTALANPKWVELGVTQNGERVYVETSSLRRSGSTTWYWMLIQYADAKAGEMSASQSYQSGNCRTGDFRVRSTVAYDSHGSVVGSEEPGDFARIRQAVPNSLGGVALEYACSVKISEKKR